MTDSTRTPAIIPVSDLDVGDILVGLFGGRTEELSTLPVPRTVRKFSLPFDEFGRPAIRVGYVSGDYHGAVTMPAHQLVLILR